MDGLLLPCTDRIAAAINNAGTAVPGIDVLGGGAGPTPTIRGGSNVDRAVLTFPDGVSAAVAQWEIPLPSDFYPSGGLALRLLWSTPATSGNMRWNLYTQFVMPIDGDQDDLDAALNTPSAVVTPASAAADTLIASDIDLDLTGARAGALLTIDIERDPTEVADTLADDADLIGLELTYQRRVVLP